MSEKYLGEVSTPLLINQIKENCAQKRTTLPIASIDELGHIYQYMGATSGSLVHGYFYECVSDGQDPATYSWQRVNTQPTVTPTASGTTFNNTTSGLQATNVQGAIDEVEGRVDNIEGKVPSTATSTNKLIDHDSLGTAAFKDSTDRVSPNNTALVESQSVYSAINTALSSIYTPRGDITCAELTSDLLIAANVGNIYETSDSGTTSALFLQGVGHPIATGSNVGIISAGQGRILFNLMANAFDLTGYQKADLTQAVEGQTTVEGALGALSTDKVSKTDITYKNKSLTTTSVDDFGATLVANGIGNYSGTISVNGTWYNYQSTIQGDLSGSWYGNAVLYGDNGNFYTLRKGYSASSNWNIRKLSKSPASSTNGDLASLDANGNLVDSGISKDVVPSDASASNKLVTESDLPKQYVVTNGGALFNTVLSELGLSGYPNKFAYEVFGSTSNKCYSKGMIYRNNSSSSCNILGYTSNCHIATNSGGAIAVYDEAQASLLSDATVVFTRID